MARQRVNLYLFKRFTPGIEGQEIVDFRQTAEVPRPASCLES